VAKQETIAFRDRLYVEVDTKDREGLEILSSGFGQPSRVKK